MKQVVLEFDDEEMELLEEQFKQIQDVAGMETIRRLYILCDNVTL